MTMFTQIEEIHLQDHFYLEKTDCCIFYGEYTPRASYSYSKTNSLIKNLKKSVDRKGKPEWQYKEQAINQCATIIRSGINKDWLKQATLIPTPPSKLKTDSLYDDRILQILKKIYPLDNLDIRELIVQTVDRASMHLSTQRYTPHELESMYSLDENLISPKPNYFVVFDDVITSGTHFKAISSILNVRFPRVPIYGLFIARRVIPRAEIDFSDLFE